MGWKITGEEALPASSGWKVVGEEPALPSVAEDVAKGVPVGLAQGVIGVPGLPGDVQQLAGVVENKFPHTPDADPKAEKLTTDYLAALKGHLPTSSDIQGQIEKLTGPFYQAKTPVGKAAQTGAQIAPALIAGGQSLLPAAIKAASAGATSELAGEGANALKGKLPDAWQPWAEPVARAVGAVPGLFAPGAVRRAVTPLPMSDARVATVDALRQTNPELVNASTAGQLTESPRISALEGRSPRNSDRSQQQAEAYTQGVMRQAGSTGMFDDAGRAMAQSTGAQLDTLRNAHRMTPAEFQLLNQGVAQERAQLFREVGRSEPFDRVRDEIRGGPTKGNPAPLDMTGERYGALRQIIRNNETAAPTSHEQVAIANTRGRLNEAFHNSMPPDEATRLRDLDRQYSNYKTIDSIPQTVGENTISPKQVYNKAAPGSDLREHASQAESVMTPLPEPSKEGSAFSRVLNSVTGGVAGGTLGYATGGKIGAGSEGLLGAFMGAGHGKDYTDVLKNLVGRGVSTPAAQAYLKNQLWRPGPNSSSEAALMARLLATPPVEQLPDRTK